MPRSDLPDTRSYLVKVPCPFCGHFASMKVDENGAPTKGEPTAYRCPIWPACDKIRPVS